ncbi:MAG: tetratricopeptide repeat protein [Acidobacteria bacterium]|nr:MAG: tetratricopeptide repeat protein [Acidobacteriota bacterium]REK01301.1 MAG: tetratricopeptide repeat protein [Acidobacteriota bacterium]REK14257.1 MAG: tetratricopeptide repeat protein [Acidobacteriota bacterium]REK44972.1 MAG: tetratricopeptide repeat protein [Acidobacteriota bacterium]
MPFCPQIEEDMNKLYSVPFLFALLVLVVSAVPAQSEQAPVPTPPPPADRIDSSEPLSELLASRLENLPREFAISREEREEAYAKLLEGQRYLWSMRRMRSTNPGVRVGARMAKNALQRAVEINPKLAEGYTALAELSLTAPPQDLEEAISLSKIAVGLDPDNFGGYRFLGRLYTIKSNLGRGRVNDDSAASAIDAWKQIVRLDPRNAEAWAFLSEFYDYTEQEEERITALRNWLSSAAPVDQGFYGRVMRDQGELTPETAALKLGEALLDLGRYEQALEILTRAVSEDPSNLEAADMLGEALENVSAASMSPVIEALRQAVFANPENLSLNRLLATTLARSGDLEDGAKVLENASLQSAVQDKKASSEYLVSLGDLLADAGRSSRALDAYTRALRVRGIGSGLIRDAEDREFAISVVSKKIDAHKRAENYEAGLKAINEARSMFGESDVSLDKELVSLYREKGDREAALARLRSARERVPGDYSLIRTEASLLTDMGRVEEGVSLVRALINAKPADVSPSIMYDDFVNYVFISSLYNQAGDSRRSIEAATNAFSEARGEERKQIAILTLASAQQSSGDYQSAEKNLREVLSGSPDNPIALNNLGYLFLESGKNFEEALELIQKAVKTDPKNPSYLDSLGWAYFKLGKFDLAEAKLRKALRYDPVSPTILEHLGDVLKAKGDVNGAVSVWQKALRLANGSGDAERIRGKIGR